MRPLDFSSTTAGYFRNKNVLKLEAEILEKIRRSYKKNKFGQLIDASFLTFFSTLFKDRRANQQSYLPV